MHRSAVELHTILILVLHGPASKQPSITETQKENECGTFFQEENYLNHKIEITGNGPSEYKCQVLKNFHPSQNFPGVWSSKSIRVQQKSKWAN